MHLNHTGNIFLNKKIRQKAHRGGSGGGTARAIDDGEDGDGATLKPTNHNLVLAQIAHKTNEISYLGISSNTLLALKNWNELN